MRNASFKTRVHAPAGLAYASFSHVLSTQAALESLGMAAYLCCLLALHSRKHWLSGGAAMALPRLAGWMAWHALGSCSSVTWHAYLCCCRSRAHVDAWPVPAGWTGWRASHATPSWSPRAPTSAAGVGSAGRASASGCCAVLDDWSLLCCACCAACCVLRATR